MQTIMISFKCLKQTKLNFYQVTAKLLIIEPQTSISHAQVKSNTPAYINKNSNNINST